MTAKDLRTDQPPVLSFAELMTLALAFNARLDTLWQRVLYTHAAIVGVMVFFASTSDPYAVPRVLVFFFYTLNIAVTMTAFLESYSGLAATLEDLKTFPSQAKDTHVQAWVLDRSYHRHAMRRVVALGLVWAVLGYLLVYPVLIDALM